MDRQSLLRPSVNGIGCGYIRLLPNFDAHPSPNRIVVLRAYRSIHEAIIPDGEYLVINRRSAPFFGTGPKNGALRYERS